MEDAIVKLSEIIVRMKDAIVKLTDVIVQMKDVIVKVVDAIVRSLDKGLEKTKTSIFSKLAKAIVGKSTVDAEVLDKLDELEIRR